MANLNENMISIRGKQIIKVDDSHHQSNYNLKEKNVKDVMLKLMDDQPKVKVDLPPGGFTIFVTVFFWLLPACSTIFSLELRYLLPLSA